MAKRVPLCEDCERLEMRMSSLCRAAERAAKARGEPEYECPCPAVPCHVRHHEEAWSAQHKSNERKDDAG